MPIKDPNDAAEVEDRIKRIFDAAQTERAAAIRGLFLEVLDFDRDAGLVSLANAPANVTLPASAERIAQLDGVRVLYVALDTPETDRVRKGEAVAAATLIADLLGDDLLLVFTNASAKQLHFICPSFDGAHPSLRRIIVERDLPRRTAVQQVANIYWGYKDQDIRAALDEAFDVGPVTKEFFAKYKELFESAMGSVTGFGADEADKERKRRFVQTLFNRLMFVYFLSRKGWLSFQGDKDYLNALRRAHRAVPNEKNFYVSRLRALFFSGLNNPDSRDVTSGLESLIGDVPFLNGGLFEETELDRRSGVAVPDRVTDRVLDELFDKFNFTVMESTPFDIEVAVDPEMLGKVFEELVTGRHDSGAYYTPRPVVSFMCREALKGYLEGQDTGPDADAVASFVDKRDLSGIGLAAARKVSDALDEVTVVDPACGSGAYLLGMMQELVELQTLLYSDKLKDDARDLYNLKMHIIQRNLYGVDIDEFAVNIAMLRMWLSLAIDFEGDDPPALPNLDFKVVCGDSLLGPNPSADDYGDLFRHRVHSVVGRLADLKAEYMATTTSKDALRQEIRVVQDDLTAALADSPALEGAVDWRVQFAEVFDRGGFNVAIANPPYVQLQKDGGKLGKLYQDAGFDTFVRSGDIYQLFYERGCQLLQRKGGLLAYITSNSWLRAEYGKPLRRYFSKRHAPLRLLELGKNVFESAIVDSGVLLLRTGASSAAFPAVDMDRLPPKSDVPPYDSLWGTAHPDGDAPWSILSRLERSVMDKMRANGTPLAEWDVKINYGIKTGYNEAFIIDDETKRALIAEDPKAAEIIKPVLRGRDIQRYQARWAKKWLIYSHSKIDENDYPVVHKHLARHKKQLLKRKGGANPKTGQVPYEWWQLQVDYYNSGAYQEFAKAKLFWMDMSPRGRFAYSDAELYCNDKGFIMSGASLKYLCALLNCSIVTWMMKATALTTGMGLIQWKRFAVERIPIPKLSAADQAPLVRLVDEILEAKAADPDTDTSVQELTIDDLVYDLYGLTEEESAAVERSLGLIHASNEEEDAAIARAIDDGLRGGRGSMEEVKQVLREWDEART